MTLDQQSLGIYKFKLAESDKGTAIPGSLRAKAQLRKMENAGKDPKVDVKKIQGAYWLPGQPRPGRYTLTSINMSSRRKKASLSEASVKYYRDKCAGGPGSGVKENNTVHICELPMSKLISIHKRKDFMDKNKPQKDQQICLSRIKYVSQKKMVPEKVLKFCNNVEILDKPIDVLRDSKGDIHVMDGHHRFLAQLRRGSEGIKANVYDGKPLEKKEKKASLAPQPLKHSRPARVSSHGVEKNLRTQRNQQGHWHAGTMPKIPPYFNNQQFLKQHLMLNPYLG